MSDIIAILNVLDCVSVKRQGEMEQLYYVEYKEKI